MNPLLLFNPSYLFDTTPGTTFLYFWPLIIFFLLVFFASFKVHKRISHMRNAKISAQFLGGIPSRMREFAFIGLLLSFARDQNIPWIGMRFWIVLLFILALAYGLWVWRSYRKGFHGTVLATKRKEATDIYRPQPKKKKKRKRKR